MRVFVAGTGRCGTSTFYHACRHITNYRTYHESWAGSLSLPRVVEDNTIHISSQLTLFIPYICNRYPDALWVHLIRKRTDCVLSLARECPVEMSGFCRQWAQVHEANPADAAGFFYDTVNDLISRLLPATQSKQIRLESAGDYWTEFWKWIDAQGDFNASKSEWGKAYNPGQARGRDRYLDLGE